MLHISPSLLAADFAHLADEVKRVEAGGAGWLQGDSYHHFLFRYHTIFLEKKQYK